MVVDVVSRRFRRGRRFPRRDRMCAKKAYASEALAERMLERVTPIGFGKVPIRSYACPSCGWWHVTSKRLWEFDS